MEKAHKRLFGMVLAFSLLIPAPAWAEGSVLSGMFDGLEPAIGPLISGFACADTALAYHQSEFEVSESGTYTFNDQFGSLREVGGVDITALVYETDFNPLAPAQNLMAFAGHDETPGEVFLTSGKTYTFVAQAWCTPLRGAWAVGFAGPGAVTSGDTVVLPSFMSGAFNQADPTMESNCSDGWDFYPMRYQQTGPVRVSREGTYYFATGSLHELCLYIYAAPMDPDQRWVDVVGGGYDQGIKLNPGQDYYIVIQYYPGASGEYFYVLAPPAEFRINPGLTDSWYNPATPGQGFFLDIFGNLNQAFLGWFTFANDPPADGSAGHRWMTALGSFADASAELAIEWTSGGSFDAAIPAPEQYEDGTIHLEFTDCASGQVSFSWQGNGGGLPPISGVIPIRRSANDSVALCESFYAGPGMPGPL